MVHKTSTKSVQLNESRKKYKVKEFSYLSIKIFMRY